MQKGLFEICHGCGGGLYTYEHHWVVRLKKDKPVFFHNECYKHYKRNYAHKIRWAQQKEVKK